MLDPSCDICHTEFPKPIQHTRKGEEVWAQEFGTCPKQWWEREERFRKELFKKKKKR